MADDYSDKMKIITAMKKDLAEAAKTKASYFKSSSKYEDKQMTGYYDGVSGKLKCVQTPNTQCSDLSLLLKNRYNSNIQAPFDLMSSAIQDGNTWSLIDLEKMQSLINESFRYLNLIKRYDALSRLSNGVLHFDEDGFHIEEEHTFQTLEEVEKALKHKAFL